MEFTNQVIGVLMGGLSPEREVSLLSGINVYEALKRKGLNVKRLVVDDPDDLIDALAEIDIVFPCLHGGIGEDGTLQLLFEVMDKPYAGSVPLACATAMNKIYAKRAFERANLPTPAHIQKGNESWENFQSRVHSELEFPVVIKPVEEGSSIGVHILKSADAFVEKCQVVKGIHGAFFVEQFMRGKEITVGVLRVDGEDRALTPIELRPKNEFYDYEAKYTEGMTEFMIPAEADEALTNEIKRISLEAHHAIGCFGFSRVDIMLNDENEPFILEVNTLPGMTNTSDLPMAAKAEGIDFDELCVMMLETAFEKAEIIESV